MPTEVRTAFGVPRPADRPQHVNLTLKPVSFFHCNPALDVPSTQDSRSVLVAAPANGVNGHNGSCH